MSWKPSDKFIQVSAGLLLIIISGTFLWRNTLKPIATGLRKDGVLSANLKQGLNYLTGRGPEEALDSEKEKIRLEEQALQEKLEQLRKKREALVSPPIPVPGQEPGPRPAPEKNPEK